MEHGRKRPWLGSAAYFSIMIITMSRILKKNQSSISKSFVLPVIMLTSVLTR